MGCNMGLRDELKRVGLSKTGLAELLGVSRMTVNRMGDDVSSEVKKVLSEYVAPVKPVEVPMARKHKEVGEYTLDEIREICRRRGGLEGLSDRVAFGNFRSEGDECLPLETDYEIAHSLGLRVWEFNKLIDRLRNPQELSTGNG